MIAWREGFPWYKKPRGYYRLLRARHRFFDTLAARPSLRRGLRIIRRDGYKRRMWSWRNKFQGQRCFILGNGPSLADMDLSPLRNEITIGSNGIYKQFARWGFHTNYLLFEDLEQTELRGPDIHRVRGPIKLAALYNAYAFAADRDTYFMNARISTPEYWSEMAPCFSEDFAEIVYLGSTVTYIALQLAFHLGCDPVILLGVDHNYGKLPELFPPGKIRVTSENYHLVRQCHVDPNYYQIGDLIGVPHVRLQDAAYAKAREVFERHDRRVWNAGLHSRLEVFPRVSYADLFAPNESYRRTDSSSGVWPAKDANIRGHREVFSPGV